ncbi:hypothetical protein [Thiolapillus sp.]|uniref:hypothetical protein n=1 Tax=Thiolapillus sp. TaxID=2017437 RepID=UPI003AF77C0B
MLLERKEVEDAEDRIRYKETLIFPRYHQFEAVTTMMDAVREDKRVFGLVIDFGTSQSPKSTRPLTTYLCPSRPGHQALRNNFASSLLLRTWLPYDWTPRSEAYFVFPLAQGTPGKQCGLAATGDYQPSLRSPWLAARARPSVPDPTQR